MCRDKKNYTCKVFTIPADMGFISTKCIEYVKFSMQEINFLDLNSLSNIIDTLGYKRRRRKPMKKVISIILSIALASSLVVSAFAADDSDVITGTYTYPPSLAALGVERTTREFTYTDSVFTRSGYTYHRDLAGMSFNFVESGMSADEDDWSICNENEIDYLTQCGFTDYDANENYNKRPVADSMAVGIAQKKIEDNGAEYTLLAVGVRSSRYIAEWANNFTIGTSGDHEGFANSAKQVTDFISEYIDKYNVSGKIKIWMPGYSRGASVVNLAAAYLDQGKVDLGKATLSLSDMYVYTYGTPKTTVDTEAHAAKYGNIHNIINPNDGIPCIVPYTYGFDRYGVDHYTPTIYNDTASYAYYYANMTQELTTYESSVPDIQAAFTMYTVDSGSLVPIKKVYQQEFYDMFIESLTEDMTREEYVERYQDDLRELMLTLMDADDENKDAAKEMILPEIQENAGAIVTALLSGDTDTATSTIGTIIAKILADSGMAHYSQQEIEDALAAAMPRVMAYTKKHPDMIATLLGNIIVIIDGHLGEIYASYAETLPDEYMQAQQEYQYSGAFKDVSADDWYAKYVDYVKDTGIMVGDSGYFEPETSMTRAMFVQTLYSIAGKPSTSKKTSFSDVSSSQWYAKAVAWASENGIVAGYEDGTFAPNQAVTREQMALMLYKYAKSIDGDTDLANLTYKDASSVSEWATEGVKWATAAGVLAGSDDGYLYPQNECTRAQAAAMLRSFCEAY